MHGGRKRRTENVILNEEERERERQRERETEKEEEKEEKEEEEEAEMILPITGKGGSRAMQRVLSARHAGGHSSLQNH